MFSSVIQIHKIKQFNLVNVPLFSLYDRLYFSSYVSHKQNVKDNDDAVSD